MTLDSPIRESDESELPWLSWIGRSGLTTNVNKE